MQYEPGWYQDYVDANQLRYFDGNGWTIHTYAKNQSSVFDERLSREYLHKYSKGYFILGSYLFVSIITLLASRAIGLWLIFFAAGFIFGLSITPLVVKTYRGYIAGRPENEMRNELYSTFSFWLTMFALFVLIISMSIFLVSLGYSDDQLVAVNNNEVLSYLLSRISGVGIAGAMGPGILVCTRLGIALFGRES